MFLVLTIGSVKWQVTVRRICEVQSRKFTSVLRILQIHSAGCTTQIYKNLYKNYTLQHKKHHCKRSKFSYFKKQTSLKLLLKRSKFYVFKNYFLKKEVVQKLSLCEVFIGSVSIRLQVQESL